MKIVKFKGGLGNQMFQYALLRALEFKFNQVVLADISMFDTYKTHRYEMEYVFKVGLKYATNRDIKVVSMSNSIHNYKMCRLVQKIFPSQKTEINEPRDLHFDQSILTVNDDRYYDGYWIDSRYFEDIKDRIKSDFIFKVELNKKNQQLIDEVRNSNSISMHVRRGNYLFGKNVERYSGLCDLNYYKKAIDYLRERVIDPHFFVFSNDITWCINNISSMLNGKKTFVGWNMGWENYVDMQIMSECKHNIIANSTFSWWGAWINSNHNKIVISPRKFINGIDKNMALSNWITF